VPHSARPKAKITSPKAAGTSPRAGLGFGAAPRATRFAFKMLKRCAIIVGTCVRLGQTGSVTSGFWMLSKSLSLNSLSGLEVADEELGLFECALSKIGRISVLQPKPGANAALR